MLRITFTVILSILISKSVFAQLGPEITSWIINTDGNTGFNNIPSNVQQVQFSPANVYVSVTGIPSYTIGPWSMNPNTASNQNYTFRITRNPQVNSGTPVATPLGHIGIWTNGVSIFNADDGQSYLNQNIWNRNAYYWEGSGFDNCLGHPQQQGEYHHHVNPRCLYDETDSSAHSPIIGYAFDGFPVYGAYGFRNTDGTGGITRISSSYRVKSISTRSNGPNVTSQYPLGCFLEDFEYIQGLGSLDEHNGRFCITPEYPSGTYAYFVTIDEDLIPVYPYTLGPTYYGTLIPGNTGPNSGHVVPTEQVTIYVPDTISALAEEKIPGLELLSVFPSPASDELVIQLPPLCKKVIIWNNVGAVMYAEKLSITRERQLTINAVSWPQGAYIVSAESSTGYYKGKVVVIGH